MQTFAIALLALFTLGQDRALPPRVVLADFAGTEARSFDDFFGQAVLIEFFAHWCAPCARQVPHLNRLQERYADRGLVVLGVTGDAREDAEPWVAEHGMAFPYAYDPNLRLQIDLGFNPLPYAVLLDATGTLVWSGKADQLDEETLERSLRGALDRPLSSWPAAAAQVRSALLDRRFAAALGALEALEDAALQEKVADAVSRRLEARAQLAESALHGKDLLTAHDIASELEPRTEGLPIRGRFASLLERIQAADDGLLDAQRELRELWRTVHQVTTRAAADELLSEIRAFSEAFPDASLLAQAAGYEGALANLRATLR